MASWFDAYAKRSARRAAHVDEVGDAGLSRRRLLVGGTAAVTAAWAAPVLLASSAAAVGQSTCPSPNVYCPGSTFAGSKCCLPFPDENCVQSTTGDAVCAPPTTGGGFCGNFGQGICRTGYKCNGNSGQCNQCAQPNVCGGEGAQCCSNKPDVAGCAGSGLTCVAQAGTPGAAFCRKTCTTGDQCTPSQGCNGGFCADPCTRSSDCGTVSAPFGPLICSGGFCTYAADGNLTATCLA